MFEPRPIFQLRKSTPPEYGPSSEPNGFTTARQANAILQPPPLQLKVSAPPENFLNQNEPGNPEPDKKGDGKTPGEIISNYSGFFGLDEEGLGKDLAGRLPQKEGLVNGVFNELANSDRDDVAYEIYLASAGKLHNLPPNLRIRFIREMVYGVATDEEEKAIADIWMSFKPELAEIAEQNQELWQKSLWESDQLLEALQAERGAFKYDVIGLARAYLKENTRIIDEEAERLGISLHDGKPPAEEREGYFEAVRSVAPNILELRKYLDELRKIQVGYRIGPAAPPEFGMKEIPAMFDPESKPPIPPRKTESPSLFSWEEVKVQHDRVCSVISSFADLYPSLYTLLEQNNIEALVQAQDAVEAKHLLKEALLKTKAKIRESDEKILTEDIEYYDLQLIHEQLFSGNLKTNYKPLYPWHQPFFTDIARNDLKIHEAGEFWTDLGLSLAAAAALIAAPFTGGTSLIFLTGFGLGIGVAQAGKSWEKYGDLATLGDAEASEELSLVTKEQINAQFLDAIIQTVAVFLDAAGARGAAKASAKATRMAYEAAEKELREKMLKEAKRKMAKEAATESGMMGAGTLFSIGMHEFGEEEEALPDFSVNVTGQDIDIDTWDTEIAPEPISRKVIQRSTGDKGNKPPAFDAALSKNLGLDFELHVAKALKENQIGGLPKMDWVIPGQHTGSGHGIDLIGFKKEGGKLSVFHFEMKSGEVPWLSKKASGELQVGKVWTKTAIEKLMTSDHEIAKAHRDQIKMALRKMGYGYSREHVRRFLRRKLLNAPVTIFVPHDADIKRLVKQVRRLRRMGRIVNIRKMFVKR